MSVDVKFYNFTKDSNSTKQPTATDLKLTASCEIFEPCNVTRPRIIVKVAAPKPTNGYFYNYAYISDFKRYYFVTDWQYDNGLWYASLACDVLGTYKSQIGAESLYVLRSSTASNGYIRDGYYPLTGKTSADGQILDVDDIPLSAGYYIVSIVGSNNGASTLYQMTPSEFNTLITKLNAEIAGTPVADVKQAVINAMFKPIDYIKSIVWVPQSMAALGGSSVSLFIGWWDAHTTATCLNAAAGLVSTYSVTIPKHPQVARGKYLNMAPYSEYWIYYQPFGLIALDASKMVDETTLSINIYADAATGIGILECGGSNTGVLASVSAQWGVPIPFSGAGSNIGAVSSALGNIGAAAAAALSGNLGLMLGATANGILDGADGIRGNVATLGNAGSLAAYQTGKTFGAIFHHVADDYNAKNGRPYMHSATPAGLGGFMIVQRGDVAIPGTAAEADAIKAILESGFYYE